jgi:hypothetical protein
MFSSPSSAAEPLKQFLISQETPTYENVHRSGQVASRSRMELLLNYCQENTLKKAASTEMLSYMFENLKHFFPVF